MHLVRQEQIGVPLVIYSYAQYLDASSSKTAGSNSATKLENKKGNELGYASCCIATQQIWVKRHTFVSTTIAGRSKLFIQRITHFVYFGSVPISPSEHRICQLLEALLETGCHMYRVKSSQKFQCAVLIYTCFTS